MSRLIRASQASLLLGFLLMTSLAVAQPPGRGGRGDGPPGDRGGQRGERDGDREDQDRGGRGFRGGPGFGGPGFGGPPSPEMMRRMVPVLDALDADDDGVLSAAEIENATVALKKVDKNGDGKITPDEMRPDFSGPGGPPGGFGRPGGFGPPEGRGPRGFQAGRLRSSQGDDDDDEDEGDDDDDDEEEDDGGAKLSADELTQGLRALVMRADVNRDGFVTGNELIAMLRRDGGGNRPSTGRPAPNQPDRGPSDRRQSDRPQTDQRQTDQPLRRGGFGGPPRDGDPREFFAQMFRMRDRDQDGVLKGDEIPPQMSERVEQIDRDGDGAISRQEMEGMMARMREGGFGPGRGAPGRRGPGAGDDGGRRPGGDLPRRPEAEQEASQESGE